MSDTLEYGALIVVSGLANLLPYPIAAGLARAFGWFLSDVVHFKRARTIARIRGVFPEKGEREIRAIARESLQNVLLNAVEMMRASKLDRAWMDRYVVGGESSRDILQKLADEGKGVVIMVPHSGNWYMAAWAMAKYGLPLSSIAARQRNPKVTAWMNRQYGDIEIFDRDDKTTLVKIVRKLRSGGLFAILPDLRVWDEDVDAIFLRGHANVSRAGAAFAVKCGSPIVVAQMLRQGNRHVFNYLSTLRPNPDVTDAREEAARLTREALHQLSTAVEEHPGNWFWYNKRWIQEPIREEDRRK